MWVRRRFPVAARKIRAVAQLLLITWTMRSTNAAPSNPWGTSIDDAWKDLVVSSAPPPPPSPPPMTRAAADSGVRNRTLPAGMTTWQEHGAPRVPSLELPVEEPSFPASDRRLWLIAGTLMGLAVLVLGVLGVLTFGGVSPSTSAAPAAVVEPAVAVAAPPPARTPSRATTSTTHASAVVATRAQNPRVLKAATHSTRSRHHKRIAAR
jgi:hypothetical protein